VEGQSLRAEEGGPGAERWQAAEAGPGWRCLSRVLPGSCQVWVPGQGRGELGAPPDLSGTAVVQSCHLHPKARQHFSLPMAPKQETKAAYASLTKPSSAGPGFIRVVGLWSVGHRVKQSLDFKATTCKSYLYLMCRRSATGACGQQKILLTATANCQQQQAAVTEIRLMLFDTTNTGYFT